MAETEADHRMKAEAGPEGPTLFSFGRGFRALIWRQKRIAAPSLAEITGTLAASSAQRLSKAYLEGFQPLKYSGSHLIKRPASKAPSTKKTVVSIIQIQ
jgi:hypothetical protein